ncbi:hypothetical protein JOS77_18230 [Chromobacterium haemolyticum]|nr:hypothetical protein JOS77_18230 [Chromobacterium haemolyticum]
MRDYFALLSGAALPSAPPPFAAYLSWLGRQDQDAAAKRWRAALGDLAAPTPLGLDRPALPGALAGADVGQIEMRLDYRADGDLAAAAERCRGSPRAACCWAPGPSCSADTAARTTWSSASPCPGGPLICPAWTAWWAS